MKTTLIMLSAASLIVSCTPKKPAEDQSAGAAAPSAGFSKILATAPSGEARAIHLIRDTAKPGDEVTISGKIMGNKSPFVDGRAVFILGDPAILTPCNEIPGDSCKTPWDTCCETPEDKKKATASIQIIDADGRVLKEGIEGIGGIQKLAFVTVTGKVTADSSPGNLTINASAIRSGK